jgi:hypothetical protein
MEDSSEDLPKPPRRTAARPFFSPRQNSGEGVSGALDLSRRPSAQLFTPPTSSPGAPPVNKTAAEHVESPAKPSAASTSDAEVDVEGDWTASPRSMPDRALEYEALLPALDTGDDDPLVVELFEHEEIELNASPSDVADEHSIEVIAYDDANSLLKAAARDGKHPRVDGLQLETTEFSFEQEAPPPRMSIDSFWESEPFTRAEQSRANVAAAPEADETESKIDEETAAEPEHEADVSAAMLADIAPPWRHRLTPVTSQALEELKESEPWDRTPSDSVDPIAQEMEASAPAADMQSAEAPSPHYVADALVRIAARVRDGELDVPAGVDMSDEAALSVVLTSLLRTRH